MDSLTQAALGGAIGGALLGKEKGPRAVWTGALISTIPDLDVVLYLFYDSFEMLSIHRGLSHSFLFSFLAGIIIAFVLSRTKIWRVVGFWRLTWYVWCCLVTHILLDAFTAYGTQLWAPFSDIRAGLDSINVVDPVYTFPMLIGLFLSMWTFRRRAGKWKFTRWGLYISTGYLLLTLVNKQNLEQFVKKDMKQAGLEAEGFLTMPVGAANVYWYGVGKTADSIFLRKYDMTGKSYGSLEGFAIRDTLWEQMDGEIAERMRWFAKGFYKLEETENGIRIYNLQVDMRGVVKDENTYAPTRGYFEVFPQEGRDIFGSGSHNN